MPHETRLAIVTGAGGGLGRAFCMQLAAAGDWHVVVIDVDEPAGLETVALMAERQATAAGAAKFVRLDVADRESWRQLAERITGDVDRGVLPRPALLINNAGVCAAGETLAADRPSSNAFVTGADPWRRLMEVNYFGALNGCQTIGPLLKPQASGLKPAIINIASIFGLLPTPSLGAYSASKAAVVALSESLYAELRPTGVRVTVVAPGFFQSGLLQHGAFPTDKHRAEAERRSHSSKFTAADVARAALAASARGQLYCVVGARARWLWRLKRLAPTTLCRVAARTYHRTFADP